MSRSWVSHCTMIVSVGSFVFFSLSALTGRHFKIEHDW